MRHPHLAACATLLSVLAGSAAAIAADVPLPLTSGGRARTCSLHLPEGAAPGARPLVLLLHGMGGSGAQAERDYGFDAVADANGVVVAYPDGLDVGGGRGWANGLGGGQDAAGIDDVGFLVALTDAVAAHTPIDPARIFVCGISNGAIMTQRLAAERADRFAAAASVAGPLAVPVAAAFAPSEPVSVLLIHGTRDPFVPFDGGPVTRTGGPVLSSAETAARWCAADGIAGPEVLVPLPNTVLLDGTRTVRHDHPRGAAGSDVVFYEVDHGGHTWPGVPASNVLGVCGRVAMDWAASPVIWRFFAAHPKAARNG